MGAPMQYDNSILLRETFYLLLNDFFLKKLNFDDFYSLVEELFSFQYLTCHIFNEDVRLAMIWDCVLDFKKSKKLKENKIKFLNEIKKYYQEREREIKRLVGVVEILEKEDIL